MRRHRWRRAVLWIFLGAFASSALAVGVSEALVREAARGRTFNDLDAVPTNDVGVVLGCARVLADGRPNLYFRYRMDAAAALFRRGKVRHLLVSGDNHARG